MLLRYNYLTYLICMLSSFVLLGGCSLAPKYTQIDMNLPNSFATELEQPLSSHAENNRTWWRSFNSTVLPELQRMALANNHNFTAEGWVLAQAVSQARASRAALFPSLGASFGGERQGGETDKGYQVVDSISGTVQASYELDLFGANLNTARAGTQHALAGLNAWRSAGLTLESEVALTWFSLLAATENLNVYDSMLENAQAVLEYQEKREQLGAAQPLDVTRQRSAIQRMKAERIGYQIKLTEAKNALCQLLSVTSLPENLERAMAEEHLMDIIPPFVNPGLPSELLARRPDIAQAEALLLAANADIGAARAAFLPVISLTASNSWQSDALSSLLTPASALYTLAASAVQSIFSGGQNLAQYDRTLAAKEELAERYQETALAAFWEVSTALTANSLMLTQEKHRLESARQADESYAIAHARYEKGAEDFLSVLDAQESVLSAKNYTIQTRLERLNGAVALFKALGGGWGSEGSLNDAHAAISTLK